MQFNCLNIISRPIFNELNYITFFSEILFLETLLRCTREKNLHKILDVNAFEVLCVYIKKKILLTVFSVLLVDSKTFP